MILSVIFNVILLILLGLSVTLLLRSLNVNRNFEEFYDNTIDDIDAIIENTEELMYKRQMVSDDPDVRKLYKIISILRDTLLGYKNAYKNNSRREIKS